MRYFYLIILSVFIFSGCGSDDEQDGVNSLQPPQTTSQQSAPPSPPLLD